MIANVLLEFPNRSQSMIYSSESSSLLLHYCFRYEPLSFIEILNDSHRFPTVLYCDMNPQGNQINYLFIKKMNQNRNAIYVFLLKLTPKFIVMAKWRVFC